MTIGLEGILTPPAPEDRDIAYLNVVHNDNTYKWSAFIPRGINVGEYLSTIEQRIYDEISFKEAKWNALEPKTRTIEDPIDGDIVIDIAKEEIVCPDNPDYYALRRAEYPPIGDQIGAMWKGLDSPEYIAILQQIQDIKDKYPKPE